MTRNQMILARIRTLFAISNAKQGPADDRHRNVMDALDEAIQTRAEDMVRLAATGRMDSEEYRRAKYQFNRWSAIWRQNR